MRRQYSALSGWRGQAPLRGQGAKRAPRALRWLSLHRRSGGRLGRLRGLPFAGAVLALACACSRAEPPGRSEPGPGQSAPAPGSATAEQPSPGAVESPPRQVHRAERPLVSRPGLGPLRSAHRAADQAVSAADKRRAIELLRRGVEPIAPAGEGLRFAYQDAWARVAQLAIELDDLKVAEAAIAQGLSAGKAASVPVAALLELRGTVHERRGQKKAAVEAYHDALIVNQELMQRSLSAPGAGEQ